MNCWVSYTGKTFWERYCHDKEGQPPPSGLGSPPLFIYINSFSFILSSIDSISVGYKDFNIGITLYNSW